MVIIHFRDGVDWYKANWAFRQLASDIRDTFPTDDEVNLEMQKAQAFGALFIDALDKSIAPRVLHAIKTVTEETIQGKIGGWKQSHPADLEGHKSYLEALTELRALL